jgi:tetratricopeptide (TPR) repeat protein
MSRPSRRLAGVLLGALLAFSVIAVAPAAQAQGALERAAARQRMDKGKEAFRAKRYREAAQFFKEAYDLDNSLKTGLYNRAFALRKGNMLKEARAAYLDYIKVNPDDNDGIFGLAETERLLGNRPEALRLFTEYLVREKRPNKAKYVAYAKKKVEDLKSAAAGDAAPATVSGKVAGGASAQAEYEAGNQAYRAGRYRDAAERYAKAFLKDGSRTDALYRRALSLRKAADYKAAIQAYEAFLQKEPSDLDGLFGLAETHRLAGNNPEATRLYGQYLAREKRPGREKYVAYAQSQMTKLQGAGAGPSRSDKAVAEKLIADGKKAYRAKDYAGAAKLFRRAQQADPSSDEAVYREGLAQRRAGNLDAAVDAYGRFVQRRPDDPDGHYGLAETYRLNNDVMKAREHFEKYIALEKRASEAKYVARAKAYLAKTAKEAERLAMAEKKAGKKPTDEPKADNKTDGKTGDTQEATDDESTKTADASGKTGKDGADEGSADEGSAEEGKAAGSTGEASKDDADILAMAGGKTDDVAPPPVGEPQEGLGAAPELHSSVFAKRLTVQGLLDHGNAAMGTGAVDKAARHFALACAIAPDDPLAHLLFGRSLEALGESAKAREHYQQVIDLSGKEAQNKVVLEARSRLSETTSGSNQLAATPEQSAEAATLIDRARERMGAGDNDEALALLKEAAENDPNNPGIYMLVGDLHLKRSKGLPALQAFQRALALTPSKAAPLYGIARAYEMAGERRVAMHHYRLYLRSEAADVDPKLRRKAWMKVEGVSWPPGS